MNRLVGVLVMLSCALVVSVVQAQDPPPPGGQPPAGVLVDEDPGRPEAGGFGFQLPPFPLLEALDGDKDGKLSKEEVENAVTALKKLDKDADGKLSKEEIGWPPEFMGRGGPGGPGMGFGGPGFGPGGPGGPRPRSRRQYRRADHEQRQGRGRKSHTGRIARSDAADHAAGRYEQRRCDR